MTTKSVPREPTPAMVNSGEIASPIADDWARVADVWRAMFDASPAVPAAQLTEVEHDNTVIVSVSRADAFQDGYAEGFAAGAASAGEPAADVLRRIYRYIKMNRDDEAKGSEAWGCFENDLVIMCNEARRAGVELDEGLAAPLPGEAGRQDQSPDARYGHDKRAMDRERMQQQELRAEDLAAPLDPTAEPVQGEGPNLASGLIVAKSDGLVQRLREFERAWQADEPLTITSDGPTIIASAADRIETLEARVAELEGRK